MRRGLSDERGPLRRGRLETQSGSLLERIRRGRAAALPEFEEPLTGLLAFFWPVGRFLVEGATLHAARNDDDLAGDVARELVRAQHDHLTRDVLGRRDLA